MLDFLKKPYSEPESGKSKLITITVFGLFIFLFLYLFKPFGLTALKPLQQLFTTFGFGLITSFVLIIFKYLIEPLVKKKDWTLGKNIIWDVTIASSIGAANYVYISIIFKIGFIFKYFIFAIWTAILVGSIPVTIGYFILINKRYKAALKDAAIPDEKIFWEDEVLITAGNSKNEFRFNPRHIIYLCSNDNYVTIVTIKAELPIKTTIRGTLKSAESELRRNNRFIRCHKCYIVNLDFIEKVTGNNQNMKILLSQSGIEIPVSRSKADMVIRKVKK